jgi:hypothetical protein
VMHSPRLTKRKGVDTRMAPPRTATAHPKTDARVFHQRAAPLFAAHISGWKIRKRP